MQEFSERLYVNFSEITENLKRAALLLKNKCDDMTEGHHKPQDWVLAAKRGAGL